MSEGWICPKCGKALAPWMPECPCNNAQTVMSTRQLVEINRPQYVSDYVHKVSKTEAKRTL